MKDLRGKNAIVTGASRGIGPYVARTLARAGVNVVLAARTETALEETRRACEAIGVRAVAVRADVSSRDDLARLVDTAARELGSIDILVNNAGLEVTATLGNHSFDQIDEVLRVNLSAPIWLTKMVLPGMLERRRGVIVNVASMAGKSGVPYGTIYSATKHALVGFSESLNMELDGTGVSAASVCPGFVSEAGMWADHDAKAPVWMKEVSPQKVADAVIKAIHGAPQVLVTAGPIRPLLALAELAPRMSKFTIKRLGILKLMREGAERLEAQGGSAHTAALERERDPVAAGSRD